MIVFKSNSHTRQQTQAYVSRIRISSSNHLVYSAKKMFHTWNIHSYGISLNKKTLYIEKKKFTWSQFKAQYPNLFDAFLSIQTCFGNFALAKGKFTFSAFLTKGLKCEQIAVNVLSILCSFKKNQGLISYRASFPWFVLHFQVKYFAYELICSFSKFNFFSAIDNTKGGSSAST